MPELKLRILEILRPPQLASFATVTGGGKPWVRYVFCQADDELTIRFASFRDSRKVVQILGDPEVHLTCGAGSPGQPRYLQVQGRAEFCTDSAERHGFWKGSLEQYFSGPDDPNYGVVVVRPYRIELCTPGSPQPEVWDKEGGP